MKENSDGNDTNVGSIGNSIEEDIKILEEFKTNGYSILLMKYGDRIKTNRKIDQALEHIVSDYKRVLKENREIKVNSDKFKKALGKRITYCNELEKDLFENASNYVIPKQEIKGKIEELDIAISECIYLDEDDEKYKKAVEKDKFCLLNQKRALQELLEEGDLE